MEAVKQGSATVGLKSKSHAVLVALKVRSEVCFTFSFSFLKTNMGCCVLVQRAQSELAAHQKKILHVDNHIGISIAGLTADARLLWWVSRLWTLFHFHANQVSTRLTTFFLAVTSCVRSAWTPCLSSTGPSPCLDWSLSLAAVSSLTLQPLMSDVIKYPFQQWSLTKLLETQIPTQRYGRRPYGVGLLIAGYDVSWSFQRCCAVVDRLSVALLCPCVGRIWALTFSRPALQPTTLTAKLCPSERALSPHAPTWRGWWTSLLTVRWKSFTRQMLNACVSQASRNSDFAVIFSGNLNDLVQHGLRALRETLPTEQDLTTKVRPLLPRRRWSVSCCWLRANVLAVILSERLHWHCGKGHGVHHLWRWRRCAVPGGAGGEAAEKGTIAVSVWAETPELWGGV